MPNKRCWCEEVAEKVWGFVQHNSLPGTWVHSKDIDVPVKYLINLETWNKVELEKTVNSWEGFGRTVEAMAKQGLRFRISETGRVVFWSEFRCGKPNVPWAIDGLIEATHLAALEAVKNDA